MKESKGMNPIIPPDDLPRERTGFRIPLSFNDEGEPNPKVSQKTEVEEMMIGFLG